MKFGNFFCNKCGHEIDEEVYLQNAPDCPICKNSHFIRRVNTLIKGKGDGWCGQKTMKSSLSTIKEQAEWRKREGDGIRNELGLGRINKRVVH